MSFFTPFFLKSAHSGPIRDVIWPFLFFCTFIKLLHLFGYWQMAQKYLREQNFAKDFLFKFFYFLRKWKMHFPWKPYIWDPGAVPICRLRRAHYFFFLSSPDCKNDSANYFTWRLFALWFCDQKKKGKFCPKNRPPLNG